MRLEEGQTYIWTKSPPEGTMKTTFKVLEDNTNPFRLEGHPSPHYMCRIQKVEIDGEDRTDEYIEKAFDGERTRGIPSVNVEDMDLEEA